MVIGVWFVVLLLCQMQHKPSVYGNVMRVDDVQIQQNDEHVQHIVQVHQYEHVHQEHQHVHQI